MKNSFSFVALMAASLVALSSCQKAQKEEETKPFEEKVVEETETTQVREMDGLTVTWIRDNKDDRLSPAELFDAPDSIIDTLSLREGIQSSVSCFLVETEGKKILFDAGLGMENSLLLPTLKARNITPDDIDYVIISHLHGDHIGAMIQNGEKTFNKAEVYLSQREHDAWMNEMEDKDVQKQKELIEAYSSQLKLFEMGDTIACGIISMDAHGHTPGHTVFQKGRLLIIADLMHGAALQMSYPEYCPRYDMEKEAAVQSRIRIMNYAKENGLLMAGMHLPGPGFIDMKE